MNMRNKYRHEILRIIVTSRNYTNIASLADMLHLFNMKPPTGHTCDII